MYILSFFAGVMTLFTPCILPLFPMVLISTFKRYSSRDIFFLLSGLTLTFTFISTLFSVIIFSFPFKDHLRLVAATTIFIMGLVMVDKDIETMIFGRYHKFVSVVNQKFQDKIQISRNEKNSNNAIEALVTGVSFGILWSACAGPILASIISLIAVNTSLSEGIAYLFIYSIGVSVSVLFLNILFKYGIDKKLKIDPVTFAIKFKKVAGYLLIISSLMFLLGVDKAIQTMILYYLPIFL